MTGVRPARWTPLPAGVWLALRAAVEPYVGASFTVPGDPAPKERRVGQGRGAFTPKKTRDAENRVRAAFRAAMPGWQAEPDRTYGGLVHIRTASGSKVDVDNGTKLILDALNKVFWDDDIQVGDLHLHLERRGTPGVEVLLFAVEPNGTPLSKVCECGSRYRAKDSMCSTCRNRKRIVDELLAGDDAAAEAADLLDRQRRTAFSHITACMIGTNRQPSIADIAARLGVPARRAAAVVDTLVADGYLQRTGRRLTVVKPLREAA